MRGKVGGEEKKQKGFLDEIIHTLVMMLDGGSKLRLQFGFGSHR